MRRQPLLAQCASLLLPLLLVAIAAGLCMVLTLALLSGGFDLNRNNRSTVDQAGPACLSRECVLTGQFQRLRSVLGLHKDQEE